MDRNGQDVAAPVAATVGGLNLQLVVAGGQPAVGEFVQGAVVGPAAVVRNQAIAVTRPREAAEVHALGADAQSLVGIGQGQVAQAAGGIQRPFVPRLVADAAGDDLQRRECRLGLLTARIEQVDAAHAAHHQPPVAQAERGLGVEFLRLQALFG